MRNTICVLLLLMFFSNKVSSQWLSCNALNTPICTAEGNQGDNVQIISDNNNGAFIVWSDSRSISKSAIYCQRINQSGEILWQKDGIPIHTSEYNLSRPQVFPDGDNGIIILWKEDTYSQIHVCGQRVDENGKKLWSENGIYITKGQSVRSASPDGYKAKKDNFGNVFVTNSGTSFYVEYGEISVQKINTNGNIGWDEEIVIGGNVNWDYYDFDINASGDSYYVWHESNIPGSYYDTIISLYVQSIDSIGNFKWNEPKIISHKTEKSYYKPIIKCQNDIGFIVVSIGDSNIIQLFNFEGEEIWSYIVSDRSMTPDYEIITFDNFAIIRLGNDLYKFNNQGDLLWRTEFSSEYAENYSLIKDKSEGIFAVWDENTYGHDVFIQHINKNGELVWDEEPTVVTSKYGTSEVLPKVTTDNEDNCIVVWHDQRQYRNDDIYAQKVSSTGKIIGNKQFAGKLLATDTGIDYNTAAELNLIDNIGSISWDYNMTWQISSDSSHFTNLFTDKYENSYTTGNITQNSYFRVIENIEGKCYDTTNVAAIEINPLIEGDIFNSPEPYVIFPNPFSYSFIFSTYIENKEIDLYIQMLTLKGTTIFSESLPRSKGVIIKKYDFANLNKGVYIFKLTANEKVFAKKIIKK